MHHVQTLADKRLVTKLFQRGTKKRKAIPMLTVALSLLPTVGNVTKHCF